MVNNDRKVIEKKHIKYILLAIVIIIILLIIIALKNSNIKNSNKEGTDLLFRDKEEIASGQPTLYGANEIYPAMMYDGKIYKWDKMAEKTSKIPQGILPEGYDYVGDINYVSTGKLTEDFQFIAKFEAKGQVYFNKNDPGNLYICITTDWIDNSYVIFTTE